uniref:Uncharacterized protein n=1 Tax=Nomascus leucogenys TaxID=61853 RepID=A0A2I3FSB0_NOMLE
MAYKRFWEGIDRISKQYEACGRNFQVAIFQWGGDAHERISLWVVAAVGVNKISLSMKWTGMLGLTFIR